jgi:hypothetical protein
MQAIGVIGLSLADVDLFPRPPRRSAPRSSRRQRPSMRRRVTQALRRLLAAAGGADQGFVPRLQHYPY